MSGAAGDEDEKRHGNARDEERVALEEPADDVSRGISGQCGQNADARSPETHGAGTGAAKEVLLNDAGCGEQNRIGRAGKRTDKPHGKRCGRSGRERASDREPVRNRLLSLDVEEREHRHDYAEENEERRSRPGRAARGLRILGREGAREHVWADQVSDADEEHHLHPVAEPKGLRKGHHRERRDVGASLHDAPERCGGEAPEQQNRVQKVGPQNAALSA